MAKTYTIKYSIVINTRLYYRTVKFITKEVNFVRIANKFQEQIRNCMILSIK